MVISRNPPKNLNQLSSVYRSSTDRYKICDRLLKYQLLPASRLVSSYPIMMICGCRSCMNTTTPLLVDVVDARNHISRLVETSTSLDSIISCASTFAWVISVNGRSLVLSFVIRINLCLYRLSAENPVRLNFVFGFPADTHKNTGYLVFVDIFSKIVHLVAEPESLTA